MQTKFEQITEDFFYSLIHLKSFFIINKNNWYREESVRPAISKYYRTLREILRKTETKHRVLKRCVDCKIFF